MRISKVLLSKISLLHFLLIIISCSPSTTVTKLYLQNLEVSGPINQTSVHITDNSVSSIVISPRISFNTNRMFKGKVAGHSKVNSDGYFQLDTVFNNNGTFSFKEAQAVNNYDFAGNNLIWNLAEFNASINFDFRLSQVFALFAGINYSVADQKSIYGGLAGVGFTTKNEKTAIRFDFGINIQEIPFNALTIASVTYTNSNSSTNYVVDYDDLGKGTHINPFANLTFNTIHSDWLCNLFIQAGYSTQDLSNYTPETIVEHGYYYFPIYYNSNDVYITEDLRGEATIGIINITPGIFFKIGNTGRLVIGSRLFWLSQFEKADNSFYVTPMIQFDFGL
jgi:hypothetical protein